MWKVKMFGDQIISLTLSQKDFYIAEINKGAKIVIFPEFVLSSNFEYIISDEQEQLEKLRSNPILMDSDFIKYCNGEYHIKNAALERLQDRYQGKKYSLFWDEAIKNKDKLNDIYPTNRQLTSGNEDAIF